MVRKDGITLLRVVRMIEGLTYYYEDCTKSQKAAEDILAKIYTYAHLFSRCKNKHEDWGAEFIKFEKDFMKTYGYRTVKRNIPTFLKELSGK
jgi:hypothetical protein